MDNYSNYVDPGENAVDTTPSSQNGFLDYLSNGLKQLQQQRAPAPQGQAQSGMMFPWRTAGKPAGGQGGGMMQGAGGGSGKGLCGLI